MSFNQALDHLMRTCVTVFEEDGRFLYESEGVAKKVSAVFDCNYQLVTVADGAEVSSYHPAVKVHAKDFDRDIREDDRFTHLESGKVYLVREVQSDSGYGLVVILHSED